MNRGIYTVDTSEPHGLRNGDEVIISGSKFEGVNGTHILENAGVVRPATGIAQVVNGKVTGVTITDPGNFYQRDFYVTFIGGGGVGAIGFATVADIVDGGGVTGVTIQEGGTNYSSSPTVVFGDETPNTRFTFFTYVPYGREYTVDDYVITNTITTELNIGIMTESYLYIDAESPTTPTRVTYITNTENIQNTAARLNVTSPGVGYESASRYWSVEEAE